MELKISLCIPTYNGGEKWKDIVNSINNQSILINERYIIDSDSKDNTVPIAKGNGFIVTSILPVEFDHGRTRQQLVENSNEADVVIFLTQDAIPATADTFKKIVEAFSNPNIGMAYGRQLPHKNAKILETHARLFNYPDSSSSQIKNAESIKELGFKTIFCSNSFAAYRVKALQEVGGFPVGNIMGEDTIVAAKMIKNGWSIAYVAEAKVYHSHHYTIKQEFKRYFDTGVFHAQNKWLYDDFGKPAGEGLRYVISEVKFAVSKNIGAAFMVFPKTISKWIGFRLGLNYKRLPKPLILHFTMHRNYWLKSK